VEGGVAGGRGRGLPGEQHLHHQRAAVHPGAQRHRPVQGAGRGPGEAHGGPGGQGPVRGVREALGGHPGAHVHGLRRRGGRARPRRKVLPGCERERGEEARPGRRAEAEGRRREGLVHHGLREHAAERTRVRRVARREGGPVSGRGQRGQVYGVEVHQGRNDVGVVRGDGHVGVQR